MEAEHTDNWTKGCDRRVCEEDEGHDHGSVLVRHQLTNGHIEAQLDCFADTVDGAANDQSVDTLGSGADNNTNQGNTVAANEEPSPAKEVRKTTKDGVAERETECAGNVDPGDVVARTDVLVDVCEDIGGENEEDVGADSR